MNNKQIIDFFNILYNENSKVNRLNIVKMRPEDFNLFPKGTLNTAHFLYSRKERNVEKDKGIGTLTEGQDMLIPSINLEEYNQYNLLDICKNFLLNIDKIVDVTIFFKDNECGIFMIEKRMY